MLDKLKSSRTITPSRFPRTKHFPNIKTQGEQSQDDPRLWLPLHPHHSPRPAILPQSVDIMFPPLSLLTLTFSLLPQSISWHHDHDHVPTTLTESCHLHQGSKQQSNIWYILILWLGRWFSWLFNGVADKWSSHLILILLSRPLSINKDASTTSFNEAGQFWHPAFKCFKSKIKTSTSKEPSGLPSLTRAKYEMLKTKLGHLYLYNTLDTWYQVISWWLHIIEHFIMLTSISKQKHLTLTPAPTPPAPLAPSAPFPPSSPPGNPQLIITW